MDLQKTADGSHTILSEEFGVCYHSKHGAIEEGIHVFIKAGLHYQIGNGYTNISIMEIGFGSGLNALLTLLALEQFANLKVEYTGVENYPLAMDVIDKLNYLEILNQEKYKKHFYNMHSCAWNKHIEINSNLDLQKLKKNFLDIDIKSKFDIIYYDAFAPNAQAELWNESMMKKMYDSLRPNGILVTYCAKGSFKRALKAVGFILDPLPGPTGKREMTRALKS